MKCKLSEKCEFGNLCKDATRHDSLTVLGCSSFKTKEPMTNEQWLHTATTEQLAEEVYKLVWCSNELFQQMECSGIDTKENDLKIVIEWLKQPHHSKE